MHFIYFTPLPAISGTAMQMANSAGMFSNLRRIVATMKCQIRWESNKTIGPTSPMAPAEKGTRPKVISGQYDGV